MKQRLRVVHYKFGSPPQGKANRDRVSPGRMSQFSLVVKLSLFTVWFGVLRVKEISQRKAYTVYLLPLFDTGYQTHTPVSLKNDGCPTSVVIIYAVLFGDKPVGD